MRIAERMVARQQVTFDTRMRTALREHLAARVATFHRRDAETQRAPVDERGGSASPRLRGESPR